MFAYYNLPLFMISMDRIVAVMQINTLDKYLVIIPDIQVNMLS
jgi:hypothetical protein